MKASFICPQCGYTQAAPEAYIGRKSKCRKCEAVGEIIAGPPQQHSSGRAVAHPGSESAEIPRSETQAPVAGDRRDDSGLDVPYAIDTSTPQRFAAASASTRTGNPNVPERYPNLTLYLAIATTVTRILAILAAGVWGLAGLGACSQTLFFSDAEILFKVARTSVTLLGLAFGLLLIYLYYVAFMAIIELIRVVMDIERNTRRP